MTSAIPFTVIGGYLGAGKTTLLNRILTGTHGRRLAVVVNDFGSVAVDGALLEPAAGGIRALANGCVCCTAVDGLGAALDELRALDPPPEHIFVEVSGVGDPWTVAQWGRTPGFALDGVIVVADPGQVREWAEDRLVGESVLRQLAGADLVLLSHADVTSDADLRATADWMAAHTDAPVLAGTDVALDLVIGRGSRPRGVTAGHPTHVAFAVTPEPRSRAQLTDWLAGAPVGVVRVKGIVEAVEPDTDEWVVQRVGRRLEVTRRRPPPTGSPVVTAVALPDVDEAPVKRWLDSL